MDQPSRAGLGRGGLETGDDTLDTPAWDHRINHPFQDDEHEDDGKESL